MNCLNLKLIYFSWNKNVYKNSKNPIDLTIKATSIASKCEIQSEGQTNTHLCDNYKNTAKNALFRNKHKLIESSRFTCISDNATSLSGEETGMFCCMSFLLQKVGQAKQSLAHTVTHSIKTWRSLIPSFISV